MPATGLRRAQRLCALLVVSLLLLSFAGSLNTAIAASDTTAPQLVAFDFTPKQVDVTNGHATVTVTAHITDDASGTVAPYLTFSNDPTGQSAGFGQMTLTSGTALDGTYQRTVTIPQGAAPGDWNVSLYPLEDKAGNTGSFGPPPGFPNTLTVTAVGADTTAPQLVAFDFTPKQVDVTNGHATVTVTAHITDDASGTVAPYLTFSNDPTGQSA
ncbi:DUF7743 domain-containing protein, partial [Streptomyces sp. NPDC001984]